MPSVKSTIAEGGAPRKSFKIERIPCPSRELAPLGSIFAMRSINSAGSPISLRAASETKYSRSL